MRILYVSERPPYPFFLGGAARSSYLLLSSLVNQYNHQCIAVGSSDFRCVPWEYPKESEYESLGVSSVSLENAFPTLNCGYPVQLMNNFFTSLENKIDKFQPDIVWAQMEGAKKIFEIARKKGVKCIFFVRDAELTSAELQSIADLGVNFVSNSRFLADRVQSITDKHASVVYPSLDVSYGVKGDKNGYITMINPHKVKGVDTFIKIAAQMPEVKFLLLESWKLNEQSLNNLQNKIRELPNVRFERRVPDMSSIYAQTKLLLVPSIWEEAFGRVAIEAQSCSIPVVASAIGGLPEAVGDGGILIEDYLNADSWVQTIKKLLEDIDYYNIFVGRAYSRTAQGQFSVSNSAHDFVEILSDVSKQNDHFIRIHIFQAKFMRLIKRWGF